MPFTVEELGDRIVVTNDVISFSFNLQEGRYTIRRARGETTPDTVRARP